jgi:hypothetical protein
MSPSIFQVAPQMYENKVPSQKPWLKYNQYMKSIKACNLQTTKQNKHTKNLEAS